MVNKLIVVLINIIILLNNFVYSQSIECKEDSDCQNDEKRAKLEKRMFNDDIMLLIGAVVLIPLFFVIVIFILMNWAKKNVEKSELKRAQNTNASTLNSLNSLNFSSKNLLYSNNSYTAANQSRFSTMESNNNNSGSNNHNNSSGNIEVNEVINSPQSNIVGNNNLGITSPVSLTSPVSIGSPVSISSPTGIGSPVGSNIGYGSVFGTSPMVMNTNMDEFDLNSQLMLSKNYRVQGFGNTRASIMSNRTPTVASVRSPNISARTPTVGAIRSPNINMRTPVIGTPRATNIGNIRSPNVSSKFMTSPYIQDSGIQQFKLDKSDVTAQVTTTPPNLNNHTHKLPNVPGVSVYSTYDDTDDEKRVSVSPPLKDWNDSYNTVNYIQDPRVNRIKHGMTDVKLSTVKPNNLNDYVMSLNPQPPKRMSEENVINIIEQYDDNEPATTSSHNYVQDKNIYNKTYNNFQKK